MLQVSRVLKVIQVIELRSNFPSEYILFFSIDQVMSENLVLVVVSVNQVQRENAVSMDNYHRKEKEMFCILGEDGPPGADGLRGLPGDSGSSMWM